MSITVRPYRPEDRALAERICEARGFPIEDPAGPLAIALFVAERDGQAFAILAARRTAELGLYMDADAPVSPRERWAGIRAMAEPMRVAMRDAGLDVVHVSVPDEHRSHALRLATLPGATYDVRHHILFDTGEPQ